MCRRKGMGMSCVGFGVIWIKRFGNWKVVVCVALGPFIPLSFLCFLVVPLFWLCLCASPYHLYTCYFINHRMNLKLNQLHLSLYFLFSYMFTISSLGRTKTSK